MWRLNGIAFYTRLATGQITNRTLSSFIPGKMKKTKDNILVRGYWGDIVNSPYIAFGQEVFKEPERTRFYKKVNYQSVYSNADISEYIVHSFIHKLEELTEYDYPFERLKHVLGKDFEKPAEDKKKATEPELGNIEEVDEEEPQIEEVTDEQADRIKEQEEKRKKDKAEADRKARIEEENKGNVI